MQQRPSRFWVAGAVALTAGLAVVWSVRISSPWVALHDFNGAVWSQAAHNHLRAGLAQTRGVPAGFYFGPLPIPPDGYYVHHPPILPLLITGMFALFGEHEWAARLVPIAGSLASVGLLWLLVRSCAGERAATLSAAVLALQPMTLSIGRMVNFEPCTLPWMLAALWCLRRWQRTGRPAWRAGVLACFLAGLWTSWHMSLFAAALAAWLLAERRGRETRLAWEILLLTAFSAAMFLAWIRLARPDAWADLGTAFRLRLSHRTEAQFTWGQWLVRQGEYLGGRITPLTWALGLVGAVGASKSGGREGVRWLYRAALVIFLMNAGYVTVFRNASYIHDYSGFFFVAPLAMMGGLALEARVRWSLVGRAAAAALLVGLAGWGWAGTQAVERMQFRVLDWNRPEPRDLIPTLGRAIRQAFPEETPVLCNFLPVYGPHLGYYAQRSLYNNLTTYAEWKPWIAHGGPNVGGVIWLGAPGAVALQEALPDGTRNVIQIDGERFCLWKPARQATGTSP